MNYLSQLTALTKDITAAGGTAVIVTSEVEKELSATRVSSGYQGEAIVDPENALVKDFKSKGWLDVAISSKGGYKNGMAQPAVLVVKKSGEVVYKWAIVPGMVSGSMAVLECGTFGANNTTR